MTRPLRIEFKDAKYHITNRGNYRQPIFGTPSAAHSFLECLERAVRIHEWQLHAFAVMKNHLHLIIETPEPNLSQGMHWLLGTWALRFNRFRKEQGHLFQGRYYAGLIEDYRQLSHVVDYVHLNPVTAKIIEPEFVECFRWSSLNMLCCNRPFHGLNPSAWLSQLGFEYNRSGLHLYRKHLISLSANQQLQRQLGWDGFSRGWAIGSEAWKRRLAIQFGRRSLYPGLEKNSARELNEQHWSVTLDQLLEESGYTRADLVTHKLAPHWKQELALKMRDRCGTSYRWLAEHLRMGAAGTVRGHVSRLFAQDAGKTLAQEDENAERTCAPSFMTSSSESA